MKRNCLKIAAGASFLMILIPAWAAAVPAGGVQGRPFLELQGQVVEIQGDVGVILEDIEDALSRITTLEGKVTTLENSIVELQNKDSAIESRISGLLAGADQTNKAVASAFQQIGELNTAINELREQADKNTDLSEKNAELIAAHQTTINEQRDIIAENVAGLASALAERETIREAVRELNDRVIVMQAKMEATQRVLSGRMS